MLEHGGKLRQAAHEYQIPLADWLDLSTALNPEPWPVSHVPSDAWSRLPEEDDGLRLAAQNYYGSEHLLPVAGSQAAIQALPRLRHSGSRIGILSPAYTEHAHCWKMAGFDVTALRAHDIDNAIRDHDVILLVNPNNPGGERFLPSQCLAWHAQLRQRGGWLIIDEAFMDPTPQQSLVTHAAQAGLIILRSLGKFFGLAGLRIGFVFAAPALREPLADLLGPWPIAGPSRWVGQLALDDHQWQQETRLRLAQQGQRLNELLVNNDLAPCGGTPLFQWLQTPYAINIHRQLAQQGILVRRFEQPASLRFGLPGTEAQWSRLAQALAGLKLDAPLHYETVRWEP